MKCLWFVFHVPNIAFLHIWLYQIPAEVLKLSNQTFKKLFCSPFVLRTDLTENKKVSFCIQVLQTVSLKLKAELKWWQGTYSEIATRHCLMKDITVDQQRNQKVLLNTFYQQFSFYLGYIMTIGDSLNLIAPFTIVRETCSEL